MNLTVQNVVQFGNFFYSFELFKIIFYSFEKNLNEAVQYLAVDQPPCLFHKSISQISAFRIVEH